MQKGYVLKTGILVSLIFILGSCAKKEWQCPYKPLNIKVPANEMLEVEQYLNNKGFTAQKDSSGLYYIIEKEGSGEVPEDCSVIHIRYTGSLANGQVFDKTEGNPISSYLGDFIPGWRIGLRHIKAGGKIQLFIPPGLAYGSQERKDREGNLIIPAHSMLIFVVELAGVEKIQ